MTAVTALAASLALALSTPATISVDGQRLASDVAAGHDRRGGAYLPLRAVSEAAGAQTTFDPASGADHRAPRHRRPRDARRHDRPRT